ncbi:hypothetical protein [Nocardioides sp.]|uniref:hypothetical protein n=1 Tax=Nocardioides sp. TaxID=35761 RepID=UPI0037838F74
MTSDPAHPPYGTVDHEYAVRLATTPAAEDGPVWMINLMKYRDRAEYLDGRETTLTGREADDAYAPVDVLEAIGAEVVFFGDVEHQLLGDAPRWDRVAVVKYPTRRSFIEMQARPDFRERYVHKEAGMEQTFVIGAQPFAPPEIPIEQPDWADVPFPSTAEDGDVMVIHVIRFNGGPARGPPRRVVRRRGHDRRRRPELGPGAVQPLPQPRGLHDAGPAPGPGGAAPRPPRGGDRRHLHAGGPAARQPDR